jgi:hypothetical protein
MPRRYGRGVTRAADEAGGKEAIMIISLLASVQAKPAPLATYRGRTMALLRRYFRMSLDIGRLPSLLGREFFRARVTAYHVHSFEDVVILVHDVEGCLERLDDFSRALVARIVFQDYTWDQTAALLRCSQRRVARRFPQALDRLSEIFLARSDCCSSCPRWRTARKLVKRPKTGKTPQLIVPPQNKLWRQVSVWGDSTCYSEFRSDENELKGAQPRPLNFLSGESCRNPAPIRSAVKTTTGCGNGQPPS